MNNVKSYLNKTSILIAQFFIFLSTKQLWLFSFIDADPSEYRLRVGTYLSLGGHCRSKSERRWRTSISRLRSSE